MQHWVNLLLSNLRKVSIDIEQEGEVIEDLFKAEDAARKEFEKQKRGGALKEE